MGFSEKPKQWIQSTYSCCSTEIREKHSFTHNIQRVCFKSKFWSGKCFKWSFNVRMPKSSVGRNKNAVAFCECRCSCCVIKMKLHFIMHVQYDGGTYLRVREEESQCKWWTAATTETVLPRTEAYTETHSFTEHKFIMDAIFNKVVEWISI